MIGQRMRRWLAAAIVLAIGVAVGGCGHRDPGSNETSSACAPIQIVGLRGMGQSLNANQALGAEVHGIVERAMAGLARQGLGPVEVTAVRYPNHPATDADDFLRQVAGGHELLAAALHKQLRTCPRSRLAVIGFSMGAQVVHETLVSEPSLAAKVSAVVLVADPTRDPDGSMRALKVGPVVPSQPGSMGRGEPVSDLDDRAVTVCIQGDAVCAVGSSDDPEIHRHAYESPAVASVVADELVDLLKAPPDR